MLGNKKFKSFEEFYIGANNPIIYNFMNNTIISEELEYKKAISYKEKNLLYREKRYLDLDRIPLIRNYYDYTYSFNSFRCYTGKNKKKEFSYDTINSFMTTYNEYNKKYANNEELSTLIEHFAFWFCTIGNFTLIPFIIKKKMERYLQ